MSTHTSIGTWVRFYRDAHFVIAEVRYVCTDVRGRVLLYTDCGVVTADDVVEARHPRRVAVPEEE